MRLVPVIARAVSVLIALIWIIAGLAKLADLLVLSSSASADPSVWSNQFPAWTIILVSAAEVAIGVCVLFWKPRAGLGAGISLSTLFLLATLVFPIDHGGTCGCLGSLADLSTSDLFAHLVLWIGIQSIAFAADPTTIPDRSQLKDTVRRLHPRG